MTRLKPLLIGIPIAAAVALVFLIPSYFSVPDYRVEVDALKVQDVVEISNVRVTNTGKLPLTKLTVNMGSGDIQFFEKLEPGKTIWVSPNAEMLSSVTVTSAEGVLVVKDFHQPVSMVAFGPG